MGSALTRRVVALGKIQTGEGVAAVPTAATDGLLLSELTYTVDGQVQNRNFLRDALSPLPHRIGRKLFEITFGFELKGGPSVGAKPEWSPLMRAAGMSEAITGGTTVSMRTAALKWTQSPAGGAGIFYVDLLAGGDPAITLPQAVRENGVDMNKATTGPVGLVPGQWWYGNGDALAFTTVYVRLSDSADPDSKALGYVDRLSGATSIVYTFRDTGHEFGTFDIYPDGILLHCVDSIVDITGIQFNAGGFVICSARLRGAYSTVTDAALPANVNYDTHLPPIAESMLFTMGSPAFSVGVLPSFNINYANQLTERLDVNSPFGYKGTRYTGRAPAGTMTLEQETVAVFDAFGHYANATVLPWSAVLGTAGNRITFSSPGMQFTSVRSGDANGIRTNDIGFNLTQPGLIKELTLTLD